MSKNININKNDILKILNENLKLNLKIRKRRMKQLKDLKNGNIDERFEYQCRGFLFEINSRIKSIIYKIRILKKEKEVTVKHDLILALMD